MGSDALAAVNLALPFAALATALADQIAMGGASVAAIRLGRGDRQGAGKAASTCVATTLVAAIGLGTFGMAFSEHISSASGAAGRLLAPTSEYIHYYNAFVLFAMLGICLSALVRNDGRPGLAFWGMVAGAGANVFLDWLFIFPWQMGIKGAAIASGVGQIMTVAILSTHFFRGKGKLKLRLSLLAPSLTGKILLRGVPEFVTQISQPLTILCFNYMVMRLLGEEGVSAYAIICNLTSLIFAVQVGVANGMQPLFGRSFGEKNHSLTRRFWHTGVVMNLAASTFLYAALVLGRTHITALFGADPELAATAAGGLVLYGLAFIPASYSITATAFFLSTKRTGPAMLIASARGCILNVALIIAIPAFFGGSAIWLPLIAVETLTIVAGAILMKRAGTRRNSDSVVLLQKAAA